MHRLGGAAIAGRLDFLRGLLGSEQTAALLHGDGRGRLVVFDDDGRIVAVLDHGRLSVGRERGERRRGDNKAKNIEFHGCLLYWNFGFENASPAALFLRSIPLPRTDPVIDLYTWTTPNGRKPSIMLEEVGLDGSFYDRYPSQCSGGQLQRVVIGRALLLNPSFLVCDEPTSALDASMRTQILNLLMDMKRRHGLTVLMISHDLRVVRYLCDRIAVMYLGRVVEIADREELFRAPKHPYTKALIASSMLDETGLYAPEMLLDGDLPSPLNPPNGCKFHTRCKYATEICGEVEPVLEGVSGEHFARCHRWREWG